VPDNAFSFIFHCPYYDALHSRGAGEGHREAHCSNPASPYHATGYNLALAGRWTPNGKK
jgi:hypothetical protein